MAGDKYRLGRKGVQIRGRPENLYGFSIFKSRVFETANVRYRLREQPSGIEPRLLGVEYNVE